MYSRFCVPNPNFVESQDLPLNRGSKVNVSLTIDSRKSLMLCPFSATWVSSSTPKAFRFTRTLSIDSEAWSKFTDFLGYQSFPSRFIDRG